MKFHCCVCVYFFCNISCIFLAKRFTDACKFVWHFHFSFQHVQQNWKLVCYSPDVASTHTFATCVCKKVTLCWTTVTASRRLRTKFSGLTMTPSWLIWKASGMKVGHTILYATHNLISTGKIRRTYTIFVDIPLLYLLVINEVWTCRNLIVSDVHIRV